MLHKFVWVSHALFLYVNDGMVAAACAAYPGRKKRRVHAKAMLGSTCLQVGLTLLSCTTP